MARIASTVEELGIPRSSGAPGIVRTASGRLIALTWDADDQVWTSARQLSMRQKITLGMSSSGSPSSWKYPALAELPAPVPNPRGWGFQIHKIQNPGEIYDTGLALQEYLSAEMFARDLTGTSANPVISLNWYELDVGDAFLSPLPDNFGVQLEGARTATVYQAFTSGWQTSPVPQPVTNGIWYPEIYLDGPPANFRRFCAWHRWAGGPGVPAAGSDAPASDYPPFDGVVSWHRASDLALPDGQAVTEWPDYSGRGRTLTQATSTKRPVVRRDPTGPRYVRFDGANDVLRYPAGDFTQPLTVFLVIRQQAPGGTQQVWLGPATSGAPLIYRFDATDQVSAWAGGTDLTYHRSSAWPSPWMVLSVVFDTTTTIWEGTTPKASGDAGSHDLAGLVLGNNNGETLPARIDLAEVVVIGQALSDADRIAMVNTLLDRNGLS